MKKIYIMEDDVNFSHALQAKLNVAGHRCTLDNGHNSPEETIKNIKLAEPDLIIIDSTLPGADTKEYLKKLRLDKATAAKPVFLLAYRGKSNKTALADVLGVDLILEKQAANAEELVDKIRKVIKNKKI